MGLKAPPIVSTVIANKSTKCLKYSFIFNQQLLMTTLIPFLQPKNVFRVWHQTRIYDKETYRNPKTAKKPIRIGKWETESLNYIFDNQLFISEKLVEKKDFLTNKDLFLRYAVGNQPTEAEAFQWFWITKKDQTCWLTLTQAGFISMSYPLRPSFAVAPLELQKPIRVAINCRTWHGFSSRAATSYYEADFIYEYLGQFTNYQISEEKTIQSIDLEMTKFINLRKALH